jgi:hypothetical protein
MIFSSHPSNEKILFSCVVTPNRLLYRGGREGARVFWLLLSTMAIVLASFIVPSPALAAGSAVRSGYNGQCLDADLATISSKGTKVQLWDCNGQKQQQWSIRSDGTIGNGYNRRCLDADIGTIRDNGTKVQMWACNGEKQQQWSAFSDGTIRNGYNGRCLDADLTTIGHNGSKVQLWDCNDQKQQRWSVGDVSSTINFNDFANTAQLTLNGSARPGLALRLTDPQLGDNGAPGSAFISSQVNLRESFSTSFRFSLYDAGFFGPADGVAFVVQNTASGAAAIGEGGGGIGYGGLDHSVAVEFDDWTNLSDPAGDHIAITENGDTSNHIAFANPAFPLIDQPVTAWIDWAPESHTLTVFADTGDSKPDTPLLKERIDLTTLVGTSGWVGITSAYGLGTEVADLQYWKFDSASSETSLPPPPTAPSLAAGTPIIIREINAGGLEACTNGPAVTKKVDKKTVRLYLTAHHCFSGTDPDHPLHLPEQVLLQAGRTPVSDSIANCDQSGPLCFFRPDRQDVTAWRPNGPVVSNLVRISRNTYLPIVGGVSVGWKRPVDKGDDLCFFGATTAQSRDNVQCGPVQTVGKANNIVNNDGTVTIKACSLPGDSGSPAFVLTRGGVKIAGIVIGNTGEGLPQDKPKPCDSNSKTGILTLDKIKEELGVQLFTG